MNSNVYEELQKKLSDAGVIYKLCDDRLSIKTTIGKKYQLPDILRADNVALESMQKNVVYMNKGIRYEDTMLFAGALPCFAMGTVNKDALGHMPPIIAMGEFHFSVVKNGNVLKFDEADKIDVTFVPNGTKWKVEFDCLPQVCFYIYVSLAGENEIAAYVNVQGLPDNDNLTFICQIDKARIGDHVPTYFSENCKKINVDFDINQTDTFILVKSESDESEYRRKAAYGINCQEKATTQLSEIVEIKFNTKTNGNIITILGTHSTLNEEPDLSKLYVENINGIINSLEVRYNKLLEDVYIRTPDPLLDAGISWAALNVDYVHVGKTWLEGGQWWNVPFTNNYQISAAISMGQYDRAKEALRYLGSLKDGYSVMALNGESLDRWGKKDGSKALGFDGIPYYIYQLRQYTKHTGDLSVISETADWVHVLCKELLEVCDPDGDFLLSWNRGCNPFMYQSDHLSVPGAGLSPSVMMAGNFAEYALLLRKAARDDLAEEYEEISRKIYDAIPRLWNDERGYFHFCIDLTNTPCNTHFYTDLVFPILYAQNIPAWQSILSLLHLKDALLCRSSVTDGLLMRMGEQKPDLFGNNYVQPVQMAEAARAFFAMGDYQTGYELLCSCGYAFSVFTENPGSAPEKLNSTGKGEADYMFGNPAASFTYAATAGLMGAAINNCGKRITINPGFPLDLPCWEFNLPYVKAAFENKMSCDHSWIYNINIHETDISPDELYFSLYIPDMDDISICENLTVTVNGNTVEYIVEPGLNSHKVAVLIALDSLKSFEIIFKFTVSVAITKYPAQRVFTNKVVDAVVGAKYNLHCENDWILMGDSPDTFSCAGTFYRIYFDKKAKVYGAIQVNVRNENCEELRTGKLPFDGGDPIDISNVLNSEGIRAYNAWRYGGMYKVSFCNREKDGEDILIPAENTVYKGKAISDNSEELRVCRLCYGSSNIVAGTIIKADVPDNVAIKVGSAMSKIALLYVSEAEVWLSGPDQHLGVIKLKYSDGTMETVPLTAYNNMGSILGNYADNTYKIPLRAHLLDSASHLVIACDSSKVLEEVCIKIEKEDVEFGLVAINGLPA